MSDINSHDFLSPIIKVKIEDKQKKLDRDKIVTTILRALQLKSLVKIFIYNFFIQI
jgi:hypothetical protein